MCGIVGHIGPKKSVDVVLEGLRRLEYRGYDSAGVSYIDENGGLILTKKEGKLENLVSILKDKNLKSEISIGHTRWATHGKVNDQNSHPHMCGDISMVHNGIIENADILREQLKKEGFDFKSETDSEVFLGLVTTEIKNGSNFFDAISNSFKKVEGHSAFVVLNSKEKQILAIRNGAPLVCGTHKVNSEALVSSDPYALVGIADEIYFPEDGVICSLSSGTDHLIEFYELDGSSSKRFKSKKQERGLESTDKGGFEHYMLKEIHEQPGLIRTLGQYYFHGDGINHLKEIGQYKAERFHISACGTASYAGMVIRDYIEHFNKIPTVVELASEFRYRDPLIRSNDIGLFISQSGETADTLAAQSLCKKRGIKTLSIVNVEGSSLYRECNKNLLIRAGIEIGVASTKAFTQQCLTGRLFSMALNENCENVEKVVPVEKKLNLLAERIDKLLENADKIKEIAGEIYKNKGFFFTGRGQYYPVALEGALKLKEIAYVHAEGYAAGELKHGPIALIDEEIVNIAIIGPELFEKALSNIQEIKARKGKIVSIGPRGDSRLAEISDYLIECDFDGLEELSPVYVNVVNQLLSYYIAKNKGTDIDKPRNLAKSVTVE